MDSQQILVPKSSYKRTAWKNGLGYTDQIAIHPQSADLRRGDFLWRISSAQIEMSSPFSIFPEHDRILVLLKGKGLRLSHLIEEGEPEEVVELPLFTTYDFPGEIKSRCELLDGGVTDLSIFIRKGVIEAQTDVVNLSADQPFEWIPQGRWNFIFNAGEEVTCTGPSSAAPSSPRADPLKTGDALRIENTDPNSASEVLTLTSNLSNVILISLWG